jgi:hypothetical protein
MRTLSHPLWQEDDATRGSPSAEQVDAAWRRLFGCEMCREVEVERFDGGDSFFTLFASGRVECYDYDGYAIYLARIVEVHR